MLVRTVLGDLDADALGRVDYHEHLFQVSPLLPGDELDDESASGREALALRDSGFSAMVDATPTGLGRQPAALARISASTGLTVIATTGAHREAHYPAGHWLTSLGVDRLAALFVRDITSGMPRLDGPGAPDGASGPDGRSVRAGMLKAGIGYWSITQFEHRVLHAVGLAHARTNAPVMVHLEHGSAPFEVLDVLAGHGVAPDAVVLAHVDRNPDPGLHRELAAAGAYLGYDGFARTRTWPDSTLIGLIGEVADLGGADRILLGGDVARRSRYTAYGGMPGLAYLGARVVPRLVAEGRGDLVTTALVHNPARLLARHLDSNQSRSNS
ncbi:phosphotriesterase [Nocardioides sp. SYSU D00065]|uniref:phosphotriesterase family protein n=1 Tax=Nocardioides sp. SYSU D00065 TaxID=2817378 RepID=UPI001B3414D6|nr:hypothetical protein [Nocardioides sp. SYSU D00065]